MKVNTVQVIGLGFFNPFHDEVSQFLFRSQDGSYFSDRDKLYYSMIGPNQYSNNSIHLYLNTSLDGSCYRPNIQNIPLKLLQDFPYAKLNNININRQKENSKEDPRLNNTYMVTSFDQLSDSFNSVGPYNNYNNNNYQFKKRTIKDDLVKNNKYSDALKFLRRENKTKVNFFLNKVPKNLFFK